MARQTPLQFGHPLTILGSISKIRFGPPVTTATVTMPRCKDVRMQPISKLKYFHLALMSNPPCDRAIYRAMKKYKVRSIVEVGMQDGARTKNMIRIAQRFGAGSTVRYTGIDLFEGRPQGQPSWALIDAHRELNKLDAKTQLVPGEPHQSIPRIANSHVRTDMVVISAGYDPLSLERSWFYIPRMLHANSLIFVQDHDSQDSPYACLSRLDIERLADKHGLRRPMAA